MNIAEMHEMVKRLNDIQATVGDLTAEFNYISGLLEAPYRMVARTVKIEEKPKEEDI